MASRLLACAALATALAVPSLSLARCRPVHGFYTSNPLPPEECPTAPLLCTAGELVGGLQGTYAFTMTGIVPADANPPGAGVTFYVGESVVTLKRGGTVLAADHGTIDLRPGGTGRQAALLLLGGGTGRLEGGSGYLQLLGALDPGAGTVEGEYTGEVCTPE